MTTLTADIAKKSEVDGMVETVVARHGTVDILVNCAGTAKRARPSSKPRPTGST